MSLPLTIAGRSPFDPIRLRWGGGATTVLGLVACFQPGGGFALGIPLLALGIGTLVVTGFGGTPWQALGSAQKGIAGTGSIIGLIFLYMFFGIFFLIIWVIKLATGGAR